MFFEWISRIKGIKNTSAFYKTLLLHLKSDKLSDDDLRDIIALFYRYKIDMKQLQRFMTEKNRAWFHDTGRGYWYRRVFGKKMK